MNLCGEYRNKTLTFFASPLQDLLKRYDQVLFENADKVGNNNEQVQSLKSVREFRSKSLEVEKRFLQFLESGIDDFFTVNDAASFGFCNSTDDLSLIAKDELEDELAINVISLKACNAYAEQLWKLNQRLAVLRGGKKVDDQCNPCGPTFLCQSLRFAVQILDVEIKTKIALYQLFDENVLTQAGDFYNAINDDLVSHRILPNLRFQESVLKGQLNENVEVLSAPAKPSDLLIEKYQAEAKNGLEELALAHQCADNEVSSRLMSLQESVQVSRRVAVFFEEPWKNFLVFVCLRHGVDSGMWYSSLKVIDAVIWTVSPDRIAQKLDQFEHVQCETTVLLKRGLTLIGYDVNESKSLLDNLIHAQLMAFEKAKLRQAMAESESESEDAGEVTDEDVIESEAEQDNQPQGDSNAEQNVTADVDQSVELQDGESATGNSGDQGSDKLNKMSAIVWQTQRQQAKELEGGNTETQVKDIDTPSITTKPQSSKRRSAINQQLEYQQLSNELGEERSAKQVDMDMIGESITVDMHELEFGRWFEFQCEHGKQPQVLKLAWYCEISGCFMFVNTSGIQAQAKTHVELTQAMTDGTIKKMELASKSFLQRVLASIVAKFSC